jgi:hypothetical protein
LLFALLLTTIERLESGTARMHSTSQSMTLGGCDIIEEFTAAQSWPISYGWAPTEIVKFNFNWAAQEVPFPKFGSN